MTTKTDVPFDVSVSCKCGAVRGLLRNVTPSSSTHFVCLCDDCQAYARFLGDASLLDANGGTEITQVGHNQVTITQGREHVACVRLFPKGMYRWYADCCKTPLANTLGPNGVFAGVPHTCLVSAGNGRPVTDAVGPLLGRVQGRFGKGELPEGTRQVASPGMVWLFLRRVSWWWLRGANKPSTFFIDGSPCVTPRVLSAEERQALG